MSNRQNLGRKRCTGEGNDFLDAHWCQELRSGQHLQHPSPLQAHSAAFLSAEAADGTWIHSLRRAGTDRVLRSSRNSWVG